MQRVCQTGLSALVVALSLATTVALAKPFTYINARYGTVCTFPSQIFSKPMPESLNGDGRKWASPDGASLSCYGGYKLTEDTPDNLVEKEKADPDSGEKVTYSKTGKNWAVVSGTKGDKIFYTRIVFEKEDAIHTVWIEYPASLKAKYDPLVGAIGDSLHGAEQHWE
ncbi:hypothetical protein X727_21590 [Mesorhizobium sp. L103C119B0]|uniref:hypothetical protein n=1 Tax=unclassified Mesorhizobium TaxID=325217 RepID=UPI0003D06C6E|nr:hypothetical protein [Mesorhizobium sp. L103C119B0]ESZ68273.1 hypothetical protein X727_21590 [Mesorhizobium sp. L103C119B0]